MKRRPLAIAALLTLSVLSAGVVSAASGTTVVTATNPQGWTFAHESTAGGSGSFAIPPVSPPLGSGAARLTVTSTNQGYILAAPIHQGTRLDAIGALQYSTLRTAGSTALAIALQFNIDFDLTDANTAFQGRLVYEPYHTHTVNTGTWQTWNTQDNSGGGNWWFTRAPGNAGPNCPQSNPCTWSEVLTKFPDAGIHATLGAVIFKAGSGWLTFDGYVDNLNIAIGSNEYRYDFEVYSAPVDKDQCKDGGWQSFNPNRPAGPFKNQGDCIQFVNTGK